MGKLARFVITGDFITRQARAFWADDNQPERAIRLLGDIEGLTMDQTIGILEGSLKLTGDSSSGIDLEPDKHEGKKLLDVIVELRKELNDAKDDLADWNQMALGDTFIAGSPTGARVVPLRRESKSRPGRLAEGLEFSDLIEDEGREGRPIRVWKERESPLPRRALASIKAIGGYDLDDEPEEKRPPPKGENKITSDTGWLSPDGKFYPCKYGGHNDLAARLGISQPYAFMREGPGESGNEWARLCTANDEQMFFGEHILFTAKQFVAISVWCEELKIELPWWLKRVNGSLQLAD